MKRIFCRICSICLLAAIVCLTGCGGFFSEEELQISEVTPVTLGDGSIQLTITYVDDVKEPDVFIIPKGEEGDVGETGNGIETVEAVHDDEKKQTVLTIIYSDRENNPDQTITIPDGVAIVGVEDFYDETTGAHTITFISGNPSIYQFDPITIPRGEKGERGNGIKDYRIEPYSKELEDGSIETGKRFIFVFDDGTEQAIDIPNPKNISEINAREEGDSYILEILYSTGEMVSVPFKRPADPNQWYYGTDTAQLTALFGKNGDYFFDTAHKEIWFKENGSWLEIISFNDQNCVITFDLNDKDMDAETKASMPSGWNTNLCSVAPNSYFMSSGYTIPVPTRKGYEFKGWYTNKTVNHVTMSPFTDLTPIVSDLTLYAIWEKV